MLDRRKSPKFQEIKDLRIPRVKSETLSNGISIHSLNAGVQDVFRLELIFSAGSFYNDKKGLAHFTAKMLGEGTNKLSASQISERVDSLGGFMDFQAGMERLSISIMGLSRHLIKLFSLLEEFLGQASFPEKELIQLKNLTLQNLKVNQEKSSYLASQKLRALLFGADHPYGRSLQEADIESIQREDLQKYYQDFIVHRPFDLIIAGKFAPQDLAEIKAKIETWPLKKALRYPPSEWNENRARQFLLEKPAKLQSSLRLGQVLFSKAHPDYPSLAILNEIFGGYYGSRLMKNIREEKGLTYGIYSNLVLFKQQGYWVIGTDVKKEFTELTLMEIAKEMQKLQDELISPEELKTVKNYIQGSFAGSINTPFDLAEVFKSIYFHGLDYDFYEQYQDLIREITPERIRELARKYLRWENFSEVVIGGK